MALGGNVDMTGHIRKDTILEILSHEFDLIFDMDDLLERIEVSSDDIDFENFKRLFKVTDDPKTLSKASSVLSVSIHRYKLVTILKIQEKYQINIFRLDG